MEFIFQGTQNQFEFFKMVLTEKVPNSELELDFIKDDCFHCSMIDDSTEAFKAGMVLASCYSKFEHLENTQFAKEK